MSTKFFDEQSDQSQVKAAIVTKYFWAWAKVITAAQSSRRREQKIAYIDLFAGPGRYKDGAKSTPLLILEQAIAEPIFQNSLVTIFNDRDNANTSTLLSEIKKLSGIKTLKHEPDVYTSEVGEEIVKMFEGLNLVPTLFFVDPWGYKGLSLRLINSVLKDWGCECIFFFNYNRINMGLPNQAVRTHMDGLFGAERSANLAKKLAPLTPYKRELMIVEEICEAVKEMGGKYVIPFGFKNAQGTRTSHHLVFVSKHPLGYGIMKEIMAKESSTEEQGVASFEYSPADKSQPLLFSFSQPLDDLEKMLLDKYAGSTKSVQGIFEEHNIDRPYIMRNYKAVLMKMYEEEVIEATRPGKKIRKNTFPDDINVTFPP